MKFSKLKVKIFFPLFCRGGNWEQKVVFFSLFLFYLVLASYLVNSQKQYQFWNPQNLGFLMDIFNFLLCSFLCMFGSILHFFFCVVFGHFGIWDNNFETFINPMIFHQIRLPRIVLNVELNELSKSAIDFNFWWRIDAEITIWSHRAK